MSARATYVAFLRILFRLNITLFFTSWRRCDRDAPAQGRFQRAVTLLGHGSSFFLRGNREALRVRSLTKSSAGGAIPRDTRSPSECTEKRRERARQRISKPEVQAQQR